MSNTKLNSCRCITMMFTYLASGVPIIVNPVVEVKEILHEDSYFANIFYD